MHWTKTTRGYRHTCGHELKRVGKSWRLVRADGREFALGRRASFDDAEALLGVR
jgi:hypothetical protein